MENWPLIFKYECLVKAYTEQDRDAEPKIKVQPFVGSNFLAYHGPINIFFPVDLRSVTFQEGRITSKKEEQTQIGKHEKSINGFLRIPIVCFGERFLYQGAYIQGIPRGSKENFGIAKIVPSLENEPRLALFSRDQELLYENIDASRAFPIGGLISTPSDSYEGAWDKLSADYSRIKHEALNKERRKFRRQYGINAFLHIEDPIGDKEIVLTGHIK